MRKLCIISSVFFTIFGCLTLPVSAQAVLPSSQIPVPAYPVGGNIVYSLNQTLSWYMNNTTGGPFTFDVQISTDSTFTSGVTQFTGLSVTTQDVALANGNLTYYWRVRARNSVNQLTDYSSPAVFKTDISLNGAPIPVASWPSGDNDIYEVKPTLIWYISTASIGGTVTYEVEIEPYSTPFTGTPTAGLTGLSGNSVVVPNNLNGGVKYHWQVRSRNSNNATPSVWSNEAVFSVDISQGGAPLPVLSWPAGGTLLYTSSPALSWYLNNAATGALSFDVIVTDTTADPNSIVYTGTTSSTSVQLSNLIGGHTYSWTVQTHNGSNVSGYAAPEYFSIDPGQNGAPVPVLSWPTGNPRIYSIYPTLSWYLPGITTGFPNFDLQISNESGNYSTSSFHHTYTLLTGNSFTIPLLDFLTPGQTYYWHMRTNANFQQSNYSPEASFTIDGGQPVSPSPKIYGATGGITVSTGSPRLVWYLTGPPPADHTYEIELKPASENFDGTKTITNISGNSFTISSSLAPGTAYHWRVRTLGAGGVVSNWSNVNSIDGALFCTEAVIDVPVSPLIGGPMQGAEVSSKPVLSWYLPTVPKSGQKYYLEISKNIDMSDPIIQINDISSTSAKINSLSSGNYYWRVQAVNSSGKKSMFSQTGSFAVDNVTGIEQNPASNAVPGSFKLEQNYPNPFNPTTVIKFSLPVRSFVSLKVFDILGNDIADLVNGEKAPGNYSLSFNGENLPSGIYFYRISTGSYSQTRKMLLIK